MTVDLSDLATRLEHAEEGSRELSNEVLKVLGWQPHGREPGMWLKPNSGKLISEAGSLPDPTRSVDECLKLVQEEWLVEIYQDISKWIANIEVDMEKDYTTHGKTAALALSAAIVRAVRGA